MAGKINRTLSEAIEANYRPYLTRWAFRPNQEAGPKTPYPEWVATFDSERIRVRFYWERTEMEVHLCNFEGSREIIAEYALAYIKKLNALPKPAANANALLAVELDAHYDELASLVVGSSSQEWASVEAASSALTDAMLREGAERARKEKAERLKHRPWWKFW